MPKRWIVTYTASVFDTMNGPSGGQFARLEVKSPTRVVEADDMEVNGGAAVFSTAGEIDLVLGPDAYWLVERDNSGDTSSGAVST